MSTYLDQVLSALDATSFRAPAGFAWFGKAEAELPARLRDAISAGAARGWLVASLARRLYADCYQPGAARPARDLPPRRPAGDAAFVAALTDAVADGVRWHDGWEWVGRDGETVLARHRR